jgi:hypothetical protein
MTSHLVRDAMLLGTVMLKFQPRYSAVSATMLDFQDNDVKCGFFLAGDTR